MKKSKKTSPFLSIIIPIFNEQLRIGQLPNVYNYFRKQKFSFEVIIINDGSTDNTLKKLKELSKKFKFTLLTYNPNKGKGYAIKTGMLNASGKFRLFTDIDLSTPLDEIEKFLHLLSKYDLLIGSRKIKGSNLTKRQSFIREVLGKGFTFLSQLLLNVAVSDFTCGFKIFSEKAAKLIFTRQKLDRWGFDAEILFIAKQLHLSIKEVPVRWANDPKSKVRYSQDIIDSLLDLLRIRYFSFRKYYK